MSERSIDIDFQIENVEEVKEALNQFFSNEFKNSVFTSLQRIVFKVEKELKATTGFNDRTGHLRRSGLAVANFNPLSIEFGFLARYAQYVAQPHGRTWMPTWWQELTQVIVPMIYDGITEGVERAVKRFNRKEG